MPVQNVYQCRGREDKAAVAALRTASQTDDDAGLTSNGNNQTKPTSSNSLTSFHSQVSRRVQSGAKKVSPY